MYIKRSRLSASVWGNTVQRVFNHSVCVDRSAGRSVPSRAIHGEVVVVVVMVRLVYRGSSEYTYTHTQTIRRSCGRWYIYIAVELNIISVWGRQFRRKKKWKKEKKQKTKEKTPSTPQVLVVNISRKAFRRHTRVTVSAHTHTHARVIASIYYVVYTPKTPLVRLYRHILLSVYIVYADRLLV